MQEDQSAEESQARGKSGFGEVRSRDGNQVMPLKLLHKVQWSIL